MVSVNLKSDILGASASALCLVHCMAAPFIFMVQAGVTAHGHGHAHPEWWSIFDVVFLIISFIAIFWSNKTAKANWIKYALWVNWCFLALLVLNEFFGFWHLPEFLIYFPALALIGIHLYNIGIGKRSRRVVA